MLISLTYMSFAAQEMSDAALQNIVSVSRDKNEKLDVTGMLLYLDKTFLQVLEGESEIIEALIRKIARDSRHHQITLIRKGRIEERMFSDWTMGFNYVSTDDLEHFEANKPYSKQEIFVAQPDHTQTLFKSFHDRSHF